MNKKIRYIIESKWKKNSLSDLMVQIFPNTYSNNWERRYQPFIEYDTAVKYGCKLKNSNSDLLVRVRIIKVIPYTGQNVHSQGLEDMMVKQMIDSVNKTRT